MYYQEIDIDDSSMPEVIYKYRTWKNKNHKKIITEKKIYFASPLEMEEAHELFFNIDFSRINDKKLLYEYLYDTAPQMGYFDSESRDKIAKYMVANYPPLSPEVQNNFKDQLRQELNSDTSVFCGNEHRDNINLWNQFGGNHKGFCIGLNLKEISKIPRIASSIRRVEYLKNKPKVHVFTTNQLEYREKFLTCLFSLHTMFSGEDELRLVKILIQEKENVLPEYCFRELILGKNISEKDKREILDIVNSNFTNLPVKQAVEKDGKLDFIEIK